MTLGTPGAADGGWTESRAPEDDDREKQPEPETEPEDDADEEAKAAAAGAPVEAPADLVPRAAVFTKRPGQGTMGREVKLGLGRIVAFITASPLYTRFANVVGASFSEATVRPNPRSS